MDNNIFKDKKMHRMAASLVCVSLLEHQAPRSK